MYISSVLFMIFSLPLLATAAPIRVRKESKNSGGDDLKKIIPPIDTSDALNKYITHAARVQNVTDIDASCDANKDLVLAAITYAQTGADLAQAGMKAEDPAFNMFFQSEDLSSVQSMLKAIANTNQTAPKQFKVSCPAEGTFDFKGSYTSADSTGEIKVNPALFTAIASAIPPGVTLPEAQANMTKSGGLSFFILKELTRLDIYASAAGWKETDCGGSPLIPACSPSQPKPANASLPETLMADLNYSICLNKQWASFKAKKTQSQPLVPTAKNPTSYAAFVVLSLVERVAMAFPDGEKMIAMAQVSFATMSQTCSQGQQ